MKTILRTLGIFLLATLVSASVFLPLPPSQEATPTATPGLTDGIALWGILLFVIILLPALLSLKSKP